ncbi:MAG TPA: PilZ domain-containing protein [Pyrinomonadaceae bacterium]|nr:PilZ domain-containing protein [Pyrinomonadaceae bacterium]
MIEKRRHPRVKASIPVYWGLTPECLKHDRITSFSIGGCFIQTTEVAPPLTVVYIRFFLSSKGERIIRGEVRYNLEEVGLGVEFINLTEGDQKNFQSLVDYYRGAQAK